MWSLSGFQTDRLPAISRNSDGDPVDEFFDALADLCEELDAEPEFVLEELSEHIRRAAQHQRNLGAFDVRRE